MDLNLTKPIDQELDGHVVPTLKGLGLKQVDCHAFQGEIQNIDGTTSLRFFLVAYPELLSYRDKRGDQIQVWYKCRVNGLDDEDNEKRMEMVAEFLKSLFDNLPYKPFYDEDAYLGYFSKGTNRYGESEIAFYINPAFPQGAWCNHTL